MLSLDGRALKSFGSQGQQKSFVLALKMAEVDNLQAVFREPPLLPSGRHEFRTGCPQEPEFDGFSLLQGNPGIYHDNGTITRPIGRCRTLAPFSVLKTAI